MEKYFEQNVQQENEQKYAKRAKVYNIIRCIAIAIAVFAFFLAFYMPIAESATGIMVFIALVVYLMPCAFFVFIFIIFTRLRSNAVVSFDYVLNNRDLIIVKVFNNMKRRKFFSLNVENMSIIARVDSDSHTKNAATPNIKRVIACANPDSDDLYYSVISNSDGKFILYFEPNAEMLRNIRIVLGRNIVEKEKE